MTTVYTIRDNLRNTIKGKKALLQAYREEKRDLSHSYNTLMAFDASINFLDVNIVELETILADIEIVCLEESNQSWANDDRQMGCC